MDQTTVRPLRALWLSLRALTPAALAALALSQADGQIARAAGNGTSLAVGSNHTCVLTASGGVKCWGSNSEGQLGDGTTIDRPTPVPVTGLTSGVAAVAAGRHTCALTAAGGVKCWGWNGYGELGDGTTTERTTPVDVTGLASGVAAVATGGGSYTCALTAIGGVKCWGDNRFGQLGDGTTVNRNTPVDVTGLTSSVIAVAAGSGHTCALTVAGGLKCWGGNFTGQLGDGTRTTRTVPVDVAGLSSGVASVAVAGGAHTCALTTARGLKCWGYNGYGQLGDGTTINRDTAVDVTGLTSGVAAVTVGGSHTCALTVAGGVKCWGYNVTGQLGDGTFDQRTSPVDVTGLTGGVASVAAGGSHTCALTAIGGVKCWGDNRFGQMGGGELTERTTPVNVTGLTGPPLVAAGSGFHTCALTASGGVKCWGLNGDGQLGDGTTTQHTTPVVVTDLISGVAAMAAGYGHTCALTAAGGVKCWGLNLYGQLGDGTTTRRTTAVDVTGLTSGVAAVAARDSHTCTLSATGGLKCWGNNARGQLGDGTITDRSTPVDVTGLTVDVAAVAAGGGHVCALTAVGRVRCWGDNSDGQLGDGTTTQRTTPVDVLTSGVVAVAAGSTYTCALTAVGGIRCWGANSDGQLGDGSTIQSVRPVAVAGLTSGVAAVTAGGSHTCALTVTGGVKCWGANFAGQLGDGTTARRTTAVDVTGLTSGVAAVAAGSDHTCALTVAGGVKCWGSNVFGELGNGTTSTTASPTPGAVVGISALPGTIPVVTFTTLPVRGAAGFALGAQPMLVLNDSIGTLRSGDNTTSATLGILPGTGAPDATVTCAPAAVTAVAGAITFAGCTIDHPGVGYVLRAAAANGEAVGLSAPFNVTLAGDTNGDCHVSIVDFSLVVSHFGKTNVSPDWTDPAKLAFRADLNGDNGVSILDFSIVVSRFGATATGCAPASN